MVQMGILNKSQVPVKGGDNPNLPIPTDLWRLWQRFQAGRVSSGKGGKLV